MVNINFDLKPNISLGGLLNAEWLLRDGTKIQRVFMIIGGKIQEDGFFRLLNMSTGEILEEGGINKDTNQFDVNNYVLKYLVPIGYESSVKRGHCQYFSPNEYTLNISKREEKNDGSNR